MKDLFKLGKKVFTLSVVAMTILWSVGVSALVPLVAVAADCPELEAGDLFKVPDNSAVYYVNADMERMYFFNSEVYHTWYEDFSGVVTIDNTCVAAYPSGGGVSYLPGALLVKTVISPDVFAVLPDSKIQKIGSEAAAKALYGNNWAKMVRDLPDIYFDVYDEASGSLDGSKPHDGMLVKKGTVTYKVDGGSLHEVDGSLPSFVAKYVQSPAASVVDALEVADTTVTAASVTDDPGQVEASEVAVEEETTTTTTTAADGTLTVSLASDTPAAGYAIKSAARVPFTKVVFKATGSDVTIDSFKVKRSGAPAVDADFSSINVVDSAGNLLNDAGKTPNSDHEVVFTEDIVVKAGESKTYTLVGNMASGLTAGNVPKLSLISVVSNAKAVEGVPVEGNAMTTNASLTLGTVTLAQGNSIGTVTKQVATNNVNLMNLKITNSGSADTKSVKVEKVVLYNTGTVTDADVSNFKLKYNGATVATGVMANKYLTFDLAACGDDCTIAKGYDRTYEVYGDLTAGSGRTIELYVYAATHVLLKDVNNSVYLTPTNNAANANINDIINISQGKINITKVNDVPSGNIAGNANNVALASWNFNVIGEPIDVRTLVFKITTTGTVVPTGLDSLVLYNAAGKALIGGVDGVGAGSPGYATSTDTFTLQPGDNILTLKATVDNTAQANDTIQIGVDESNTSNFIARGVNSGLDITLGTYATPQSVVSANTKTVQTSALNVTTLSTPAAQSFVPGMNGVLFSKVVLDASNSSEDLKISQFKTKNTTGAAAKTIDIQNIRLWVDKDGDSYNGSGTAVALTEVNNGSDSTAGNDETFTFNLSGDDQFLVKAGKKLIVEVRGNIAGGAATGATAVHVFASNVANDVSATGQTTKTTVTESIDTGTAGQGMTILAAGGQLEVALASDSQTSKLLAAGTTVTLGSFKFLATTTEDVELDYMYLTQVVTDNASSSPSSTDEIWFEDAAGNEIAGTRMSPTSSFPKIDFGDDAFVVKTSDNGKVLYLKAKLAPVGSGYNGVSGYHVGYKVAAAGNVVAKGDLSGTGATEWLSSSSAPTGYTNYIYKAYPVFAKKTVSTTLANGTRDLFKFQISAVNGDISLMGFTFDVATTTAIVGAGTMYVYDLTGDSELQVNETGGSAHLKVFQTLATDNDWDTSYSADEITVSVNVPRTFVVRGNVSGAAAGASVSVAIAGDGALITGAATNMLTSTNVDSQVNDDFIWSDKNNNSHSTTTADWTNGYLVSGLSSTTGTSETVAL